MPGYQAMCWLGDENPEASATALLDFFLADEKPLPPHRF
jgi:hypothetical protein